MITEVPFAEAYTDLVAIQQAIDETIDATWTIEGADVNAYLSIVDGYTLSVLLHVSEADDANMLDDTDTESAVVGPISFRVVRTVYLNAANTLFEGIRTRILALGTTLRSIRISGFSSGGAIATLLAITIKDLVKAKVPVSLLTFGSPKVLGSEHNLVERLRIDTFRWVIPEDPRPMNGGSSLLPLFPPMYLGLEGVVLTAVEVKNVGIQSDIDQVDYTSRVRSAVTRMGRMDVVLSARIDDLEARIHVLEAA